MAQSYKQGMIDGIKLWGEVCGKQGNCEDCPIGTIRGANVTCQDFARQFPAKMLSILSEMNEGEITYHQEFCTRFPECNMDIETLADSACRKAIFEGYLECEGGDCVACWQQSYVGDVSEADDEDEDSGLVNV